MCACMYIYVNVFMYTYTMYIHRVSQKNCAKLFLSELCQISINFNNFWQVDEKMAQIIFHINIFHLTSLMSSQYLVKQKSAKFVHNAQIITCYDCAEMW